MKVILKSVLAETNLDAPPKSLFSDVYSRVCDSLGLKETWYFGLCYQPNRTTDLVWLDTSKKVLKKLPTATKNLSFRIKYYPEDVGTELIENITLQIFYLEIKKAILSNDIYCPADTAALLASYSLQVEFGDFNENRYNRYLMAHQEFLPRRVFKLYDLNPCTWTASITAMWKKLSGMDPEEAMLEYLKLAQNLDMFGVSYFNILNKKKTKLLIGVTPLGLNIYTPVDKLTPQLSFSWSEIKKLRFKGKKFLIRFMGKKIPNFTFYTTSKIRSKQIYNLSLGNQELYIRRREPDSPEVTVLRERAKALRDLRLRNKEKLKLDISSKEDSLRREEEYQHHLQKLQQDLESTMQRIQQEIAEKLEETKKLQKQIEAARKDEEDYKIKLRKEELDKLRRKAMLEDEARREKEISVLFSDPDNTSTFPEVFRVDDELQVHVKKGNIYVLLTFSPSEQN
ncbi:moesin/ezrin/radixin homolog 1-like isoform X2 [Coccinella septempunctata]|uniref:moesin/ezrin/radixin homolog 1-like isoform X2 n=1 Tax=Coccinella septempunctata TaxID=41139 RepID=UPI001D076523|nr:moesin/ezrin/radixin homolog 1-like isoform X2 [Coccinella septempunctata]